MYKLITFLLLVSTFDAISQTKSETIEWLNSKMPKGNIYSYDNFGNSILTTIVIEKTGEVVKEKEVRLKIGGLHYYKFTGNFKSMNPNSIVVKKEKDGFYLTISCTNNKECVKQILTSTYDNKVDEFELDGLYMGPFSLTDANLDSRIIKALKHLVILCGGKKELF